MILNNLLLDIGRKLIVLSGNKSEEILKRVDPKELDITEKNWLEELEKLDSKNLIGTIKGETIREQYIGCFKPAFQSIKTDKIEYSSFQSLGEKFRKDYHLSEMLSPNYKYSSVFDDCEPLDFNLNIWRGEHLERRYYRLHKHTWHRGDYKNYHDISTSFEFMRVLK
ncbi:MAG: hypothetical protein PHH54_03560 [Candidatus Nanoarchaeia archaeon]|nr:hypothetical protein [Candidatus Nanoarchaeia archaeon]MDD5741035.1 hypothetical protein [Candidatus Nanoarchaeia archaeon]